MIKLIKCSIVSILIAIVCTAIVWCGGFNFERGDDLVAFVVGTLIASGFGFFGVLEALNKK